MGRGSAETTLRAAAHLVNGNQAASSIGPFTTVVRMITGELKTKIDGVWNAFWSGGISNPLEVIEQITYLLFIRRLDDLQTLAESRAQYTGILEDARFTIRCSTATTSTARCCGSAA